MLLSLFILFQAVLELRKKQIIQHSSNERYHRLNENATRRKFILNEGIRKKVESYLKKNKEGGSDNNNIEISHIRKIRKEKNELIKNLLIQFNHEIIYHTINEIIRLRQKQLMKERVIENAKKKISKYILSRLVKKKF